MDCFFSDLFLIVKTGQMLKSIHNKRRIRVSHAAKQTADGNEYVWKRVIPSPGPAITRQVIQLVNSISSV